MREKICISVNSQPQNIEGDSPLAAALLQWGYDESSAAAVAVNQSFVPKTSYAEHILHDGDQIDIVQPISGG